MLSAEVIDALTKALGEPTGGFATMKHPTWDDHWTIDCVYSNREICLEAFGANVYVHVFGKTEDSDMTYLVKGVDELVAAVRRKL